MHRFRLPERATIFFLTALPFILPLYVWRPKLGPLPTTGLELYLAMTIVVFCLQRGLVGWRDGWTRLRSWRWPVIAWVFATLLAVFIAPDKIAALGLWRAYVLEPLLVFVMLADVVRTEADAARIRRSFFWTVIALALWTAFQFVTGKGIPTPWNVSIAAGRRATGPFPFPNALSLFVAPIGAWAFARWTQNITHHASRIISFEFWTWGTSLAAILMARSDGGLVAFLVVAFLAMLIEQRTRKLAIGLLIATALLFVAFPAVRQKVWMAVSFQEWSGKVRVIMWEETWTMLKDHPVFGAGFGAYPTVIKPYHRATFLEIFQFPHNILLNLWSEVGLFGIFVFGWIAVTWARLCRPDSADRTGHPQGAPLREWVIGLAPIIAMLVQGLVDVPYFKNDLAIAFWMLAFLTTFRLGTSLASDVP